MLHNFNYNTMLLMKIFFYTISTSITAFSLNLIDTCKIEVMLTVTPHVTVHWAFQNILALSNKFHQNKFLFIINIKVYFRRIFHYF